MWNSISSRPTWQQPVTERVQTEIEDKTSLFWRVTAARPTPWGATVAFLWFERCLSVYSTECPDLLKTLSCQLSQRRRRFELLKNVVVHKKKFQVLLDCYFTTYVQIILTNFYFFFLFRTVPSPTPYGRLLARLGVRNPHPKLIAIIPGTGAATDIKFGRNIYRVHTNKSPLKMSEKREHGCIQGLSKFFGYPLLSQEQVKLRTSHFVRIFIASIGRKARYSGKVAVGIVRDSRKFSEHSYIGRIARSSLR